MDRPRLWLTVPSQPRVSHLPLRLCLLGAPGEARNCKLVQPLVLVPSLWRAWPSISAPQRPPLSQEGHQQLLPSSKYPWAGPGMLCNPCPRAASPRHRGGSAGTLISTAVKIGPAWQGEEGEGQDPTAAPQLALGTGELSPGSPLLPSCSASCWVVMSRAQLLRAIVSTTCSSLLRSRCLRACSSFSSATRISSLYLAM